MTTLQVRPEPALIHGLHLVQDRGVIYPLTPCCGVVAVHAVRARSQEPAAMCSGCYRHHADAYVCAAVVGSQYLRRDLRQMLESLTDCSTPSQCAGILVDRFAGTLDTPTHTN